MMINYMILSHARTGSNFLVGVLAQHPEIESHNELFNEQAIFTSRETIYDEKAIEERDKAVIPYLRMMLDQSHKPVRGFKHLLFNSQEVIDYVMHGAFHLILLERNNILAQYSSLMIAHQTEQWTLLPDDERVKSSHLVWDVDSFEEYRKQYEYDYSTLKERMSSRKYPNHHICYHDLFVQEALDGIFAFLEVPPLIVDSNLLPRKQNATRIIDRFTQPDAVEQHLIKIKHPEWATETIA